MACAPKAPNHSQGRCHTFLNMLFLKLKPIFILILIYFPLCGQEIPVKNFYGTWEGTESEIDQSLMLTDESSNNTIEKKSVRTFYFQENGFVDLIELGEQFKLPYSIKDSILSIGNNLKYKILEVQPDRLFLKTAGFFKTDLILEKKETNIKPIPSNEHVEAFHQNGIIKLKGTKENGLKKGIWTEWYEDGSVKQVELYESHMPIMTIIFNNNGTIVSKRWFDFTTQTFIEE